MKNNEIDISHKATKKIAKSANSILSTLCELCAKIFTLPVWSILSNISESQYYKLPEQLYVFNEKICSNT